jgi:hypothetical protein
MLFAAFCNKSCFSAIEENKTYSSLQIVIAVNVAFLKLLTSGDTCFFLESLKSSQPHGNER